MRAASVRENDRKYRDVKRPAGGEEPHVGVRVHADERALARDDRELQGRLPSSGFVGGIVWIKAKPTLESTRAWLRSG